MLHDETAVEEWLIANGTYGIGIRVFDRDRDTDVWDEVWRTVG